MEVPPETKDLYRHWNHHVNFSPANLVNDSISQAKLGRIVNFATERMLVWERKVSGQAPPYTQDPIIQKYRFCNIYRELDRQTIEIHKILNPIRDDFNLWLLNLAFNRFLCKPETFEQIGFLSFDTEDNSRVMERLLDAKRPKYGSAYVFPISIIQRSEFDTREKFFTQYLPTVIPRVSKIIEEFNDVGVSRALELILPAFGFNFKFHWTEILIDIAYQFPECINLYKLFPIGPGSIPTMKSLASSDPEYTALELVDYQLDGFPYLQVDGQNIYLSAENWEGIGCEYRKYLNLSTGKGRKRRYGLKC